MISMSYSKSPGSWRAVYCALIPLLRMFAKASVWLAATAYEGNQSAVAYGPAELNWQLHFCDAQAEDTKARNLAPVVPLR